MKYDYYLGIDPDTEKSGVALWSRKRQQFVFVKSIEFWDLVDFIQDGELKDFEMFSWVDEDVQVIIEGGWLVEKSNFHKEQGVRRRERIAKNVGMNHEVGILLEALCKRIGMPCEVTAPSGMKLDARVFRQMTKWEKTTNQDNRDAAMLVFKK